MAKDPLDDALLSASVNINMTLGNLAEASCSIFACWRDGKQLDRSRERHRWHCSSAAAEARAAIAKITQNLDAIDAAIAAETTREAA